MKFFSIIVTYNGMQRNCIQKCLDSLFASSVQTEIIVIDNGSTDGCVEFIKQNYPQVDLIVTNENLGFAKANNIGIRKAYDKGADYFFLINQDVWIEGNTIEKLVEAFKQLPKAGIVSPIHLNANKSKLDYSFTDSIIQQYTPNFISDLYLDHLQDFYETKMVNAAAWLICRQCIEKVGGFDTLVFYHYGEDDNYCQRVLYHGFKIYITTKTTICHDTEERKGDWTFNFQEKQAKIARTVFLANVLLDDHILNDLIGHVKKKLSLVYFIKRMLLLNLKTLILLCKNL